MFSSSLNLYILETVFKLHILVGNRENTIPVLDGDTEADVLTVRSEIILTANHRSINITILCHTVSVMY